LPSQTPFWRDADLLNNCNLWLSPSETYYNGELTPVIPEDWNGASILTQGDSFSQIIKEDLTGIAPVIQITRSEYYYIPGFHGDLYSLENDFTRLDLAALLDQTDVVVIETVECLISKYSYGFADYLNEFLDTYSPANSYPAGVDFARMDRQQNFFSTGTYPEEDGFVWLQKESSFVLNAAALAEKGLTVRLSVPSAISDRAAPGDVATVRVNGVPVGQLDLTVPGETLLTVPPDKLPRCRGYEKRVGTKRAGAQCAPLRGDCNGRVF